MKKLSDILKSKLTDVFGQRVFQKNYAKIYECAFRSFARTDSLKALEAIKESCTEEEKDVVVFAVNIVEVLIMECLSQNLLEAEIKASLEDVTESQDQINDFVDFFSGFKARLDEPEDKISQQVLNSSIDMPKIMDVEWKLLYNISSTFVYKLNKDVYIINLKVLDESNTIKDLQFKCSYEELQALVSSLQHAVKSISTACQSVESLLKQ